MQILNFILNQVPALTNSQSSNSEKNTNVKTTRRQQRFGKNVAQTRFGGEFWALYEVAYKASYPIFIYFLWILLIHDKLVECYQMHFDWDNETHWVRKYEMGNSKRWGEGGSSNIQICTLRRRVWNVIERIGTAHKNMIQYSKKQSEGKDWKFLEGTHRNVWTWWGVSKSKTQDPQQPLPAFKISISKL